jgi:hypothetical protein
VALAIPILEGKWVGFFPNFPATKFVLSFFLSHSHGASFLLFHFRKPNTVCPELHWRNQPVNKVACFVEGWYFAGV